MRVKKFEAKTMKDALQMVKNELGPDAVILAARDNRKSFGLGGDGSVEVTAAISEGTLHKKKFVESRLLAEDKERFQRSPARLQKEIIDRMTNERLQRRSAVGQEENARRPITRVSYIDIADEAPKAASSRPRPSGDMEVESTTQASTPLPDRAKARIRSAVREAWRAGLSTADEAASAKGVKAQSPQVAPRAEIRSEAIPVTPQQDTRESEIVSLKGEISRLQSLLEGFQRVPQAFVGAHPGAEFGIGYDLSAMFQRLSEAGLSSENTVEILSSAQKEMDAIQLKKRPLVDAFVARWLLNSIQIEAQPYGGRIHCFVGGSGSGKTSSLVKMASHLVVKEKKKVAVLTTDSFKVGAADQLKIYCQILNVPFAIVRNSHEWEWILSQLAHIDHILVDFPGLQLRDLEEIHLLKSLLPPRETQAACHMVVSTTTKDSDALEMGRRYRVADFSNLIFTNLDQSVQHGLIYNFQKKTGKPLHSFGTGARIPEDFELATKERVVDLLFKLTRIRK